MRIVLGSRGRFRGRNLGVLSLPLVGWREAWGDGDFG